MSVRFESEKNVWFWRRGVLLKEPQSWGNLQQSRGGGGAQERKGGGEMLAERAAVWRTGCQRARGGGEWLGGRRGDGGD